VPERVRMGSKLASHRDLAGFHDERFALGRLGMELDVASLLPTGHVDTAFHQGATGEWVEDAGASVGHPGQRHEVRPEEPRSGPTRAEGLPRPLRPVRPAGSGCHGRRCP
jgi:hypothetical protein